MHSKKLVKKGSRRSLRKRQAHGKVSFFHILGKRIEHHRSKTLVAQNNSGFIEFFRRHSGKNFSGLLCLTNTFWDSNNMDVLGVFIIISNPFEGFFARRIALPIFLIISEKQGSGMVGIVQENFVNIPINFASI